MVAVRPAGTVISNPILEYNPCNRPVRLRPGDGPFQRTGLPGVHLGALTVHQAVDEVVYEQQLHHAQGQHAPAGEPAEQHTGSQREVEMAHDEVRVVNVQVDGLQGVEQSGQSADGEHEHLPRANSIGGSNRIEPPHKVASQFRKNTAVGTLMVIVSKTNVWPTIGLMPDVNM